MIRRLLPFVAVAGCLLGVEPRESGIGFDDGEGPCEEDFQCLSGHTCSWLEAVCRPACSDTSQCDDDRVCISVSEGEILGGDFSLHFDGCIPEDEIPEPEDLPDDVSVSIMDDSAGRR